jgi:hypothetical protein
LESLTNLYALADFRSLQPNAGSAGWLNGFTEFARADPGIAALLGPAGLAFGATFHQRVKFGADSTSLLCAALSSRVAQDPVSLAIEVPAAARDLPLLLAATILLGDTIISKLSPHSGASRKESGVLLVSPDLNVRLKYLKLFSDEAREKTYPGLRMNRRGRIELIKASRKHQIHGAAYDQAAFTGLCFFYPAKRLPDNFDFAPQIVIVDARYARFGAQLGQLISWAEAIPHAGKLYLYTCRDASAERIIRGRNIPQFPFDAQAVATVQEQISHRRAATTPGFDCRVSDALVYTARNNEIRAASSEGALPKRLLQCEALLNEVGDTQDRALHRARWLLSTLRHLPVPTKYFDEAASHLHRWGFKKMLGTLDYISKDTRYAPVVQSLRVLLEQAYLSAYENCDKEPLLKEAIEVAFLTQDASIGILSRDPTSRKAIEIWLNREYGRDVDVLDRVSAVTYRDYYKTEAPRFGVTVIPGLLSPSDHGWLYDADLGTTCTFLTYEYEVARLKERLTLSRRSTGLGASEKRYAVLGSIGRLNVVKGGAEAVMRPITIEDGTSAINGDLGEKLPRKERLKTIGRDFAALRLFVAEPSAGGQSKETSEAGNSYEDEPVEAGELDETTVYADHDEIQTRWLRVAADGVEYDLYVDELRSYEVVRGDKDRDDSLTMLFPKEMRAGDTLLLTDSAERANIFEQVLAVVESDPEMKPLASIRRSWQNVLLKLRDQYSEVGVVDVARLLSDLRSHQAPIESEATVRGWIKGSVIGPGSVKSISAIAKLAQSGDMKKRPQEYDEAFKQIRSIHRALGRRINALISNAKLDITDEGEGDSLEDAFELPLRELMQSVEPVTIIAVGEQVETRKGSDVQKLFPRGDAAMREQM